MDNNLLISIAFPGDTYQKIMFDLDELMSQNFNETWTISKLKMIFNSGVTPGVI